LLRRDRASVVVVPLERTALVGSFCGAMDERSNLCEQNQ